MDELTREQRIAEAARCYGNFLTSMGFDWENDPNMVDTPRRVAKAHYDDLWSGIYGPEPKITAFENVDEYDGMVFQGNIEVHSVCSHHSLPFIGKAHVAYLPGDKVIGLSKLNRIVEYFSRRPQVQENLTMQIHDKINQVCEGNNGVAVMIEAKHTCAHLRGVKHDSKMVTSKLSGGFKLPEVRNEFFEFIKRMQ